MNEKYKLGVDIGGTNIKYALVNQQGTLTQLGSLKTKDLLHIEDLFLHLKKVYKQEIEQGSIKGVGIGAPAANYRKGIIDNAANLPWKGVVPVAAVGKECLELPVWLTNDANAAAIGEQHYGAAQGMSDFALITLGTGVGSGIVLNNSIVEGYNGMGGEFGHIVIEENGRSCGCGRQGCLETYTSATGIVQTAMEMHRSNPQKEWQHIIENEGELSSLNIYNCAKAGHEESVQVLSYTGELIGKALANLVTLLGLEAVFLYGGPVAAGDLLFDSINRCFKEQVLHFYKEDVLILPSQLQESNIAILGAAGLVR